MLVDEVGAGLGIWEASTGGFRLRRPDCPEARAVAVLYAATMLMMGLTFAWGWRYLATHPELVAEPARSALPAGAHRALLGSLVYLIAIAVAFLSPVASFAVDAIDAVYFAASRSRVPGLLVRAAHTDDPG